MNIKIRPLVEEDAMTSVAWRNDPSIWKYTGSRPTNVVLLGDEIDWIRSVINDPTCRRFAIIVDDTYIGNSYITNIKHKTADFQIFIGIKSYWGKGIAKIVTKKTTDFAFDELGVIKINLVVNSNNLPAVNIYNSLGFEEVNRADSSIHMTLGLNSRINAKAS